MTTYIDTSTLSKASVCRLAAFIQYVLHKSKRGESEAPLVCGTVLHTIEELRQAGKPVHAAIAVLDKDYKEWADTNLPGDDIRAYSNVKEIVETWFSLYPVTEQAYPTIKGSVEVGVSCALDDNGEYILVGRLDKMVNMAGAIIIDDFKHTKMNLNGKNKERWVGFYERTAQGPAYITMAQDTLKQPIVGMKWSTLSIAPLPNSSVKCKVHHLPYKECRTAHLGFVNVGPRVYSHQEMANWKHVALDHAKRWQITKNMNKEDVPEDGWYTGECNECQYNTFCRSGKPWDMLDAEFETHKWEPYEHAFGKEKVST